MDAFGKKIGPLPVYGWLLAAAAGVLLWHWYARSRGTVTTAASFNTPPLVLDGSGNVTNTGAVSNGGGMHLGLGQLGPTVVTPPLSTSFGPHPLPAEFAPGYTPTGTPSSRPVTSLQAPPRAR